MFGYCIVVSLTAFSVICNKTFCKVYTLLSHTPHHTKSPLSSRGRDTELLQHSLKCHMKREDRRQHQKNAKRQNSVRTVLPYGPTLTAAQRILSWRRLSWMPVSFLAHFKYLHIPSCFLTFPQLSRLRRKIPPEVVIQQLWF